MDRSKARLDAVATLLDRREWSGHFITDSVLAVNLYSDASPVVGVELQGMVMDVVFKPAMHQGHQTERRTLSGSSLRYGGTDWSSKVISLLLAVFLVIGPSMPEQLYFWGKVRSVTTDYGTELNMQLVCNALPAFLRWVI